MTMTDPSDSLAGTRRHRHWATDICACRGKRTQPHTQTQIDGIAWRTNTNTNNRMAQTNPNIGSRLHTHTYTTHTHTCTHTTRVHTCTYKQQACAHVHLHTHPRTHTHTRVFTHTHTHTHRVACVMDGSRLKGQQSAGFTQTTRGFFCITLVLEDEAAAL